MSSWFFHSLVFFRYTERHDIPDEYKSVFHLGCFAPDLVTKRASKKETHYGFGLNKLPLRYGIKKYIQETRYLLLSDQEEVWFHRGYLLHLRIDAIWLKKCLFPAIPKFLLSSTAWREGGKIYYGEMATIDRFYRSKYSRYHAEERSTDLLANAKIPELNRWNSPRMTKQRTDRFPVNHPRRIIPINGSIGASCSSQKNSFCAG